MLIVKSGIKEAIGDLNMAGDLPEALEKKVAMLLKEAIERAKANNRRTVMAKDL